MSKDEDPRQGGEGNSPEALAAQMRAVPTRGPDPLASERILRRARAAFLRSTRLDERWLARLDRLYGRLEPGLAAGVVIVYLGWALRLAIALVR
jgi:hypothetical protein